MPTAAASTASHQAAPRPTKPYHRVLLKISGEALSGAGAGGLDPAEIDQIAREIRTAKESTSGNGATQIALVVGGGNFIRGAQLAKIGHIHQGTADYMGMLATVINGLALREALLSLGVDSRVMSAIEIKAVAEPFIRGRALRHMDKGRVVILVGGTGNPFCTTDTCAALRARELDCQVILKATKVDGVYSADPRKDPTATRFDRLTFSEVIQRRLAVMDMTAFTMCQEGNIPIIIFDFRQAGSVKEIIQGAPLGTLIAG